MIESSVNGNRLNIKWSFSIPLDTKQLEAAIKKTGELISKLKKAQDMINKIGVPF